MDRERKSQIRDHIIRNKHITIRSIFSIIAMLVIFAFIVAVIGYKGITDALLAQYSEDAFRTAETADDLIDPDDLVRFSESEGKTPEYNRVLYSLDRLCNSAGVTFIYVIQPDRTDYGHITFIFSTGNHKNTYELYEFGYVRETTNDEYRAKYRALYETSSRRQLVIRDKGYIQTDPHITAMIPLKGSDNKVKAILCVQRQMDALASVRDRFLTQIVIAMVVLAIIVTIFQGLFLNAMLLEPLRMITSEASRFARENIRSSVKLADSIRNRDEIGVLAVSIDTMEDQILDYVDNLTAVTAEKERIGTELELAARIQASMIPSTFPAFPDRRDFDIFASMTPAKTVGGDFYDFFLVDDDHLAVVMADVSGKGIPAALFMMSSMNMIRNCVLTGMSPAEVMETVNDQICSNNHEDMFVTVWIGILDLQTGTLKAANAGHEYPYLTGSDGKFELFRDRHGLVLGAMEGMKYHDYELQLDHGAKIFLYTDGVPEATDPDNNLFGADRTCDALNSAIDGDPETILNAISNAVKDFAGSAEQFDDLTMLCLHYI